MPPSHSATFALHVRPQKTGKTQLELVQRKRNAVDIDKDVMWSPWTLRMRSKFRHVQNKGSEDMVDSGRSKNLIRTLI